MESEAPEAPVAPEPTEEAPDFPQQPAIHVVPVEFIIDSHCISAEIHHPGAPRRLVDYLNAVDGPRFDIRNITVSDGREHRESDPYTVAQFHRNAILIAIPRGNTSFTARSLEVVPKRPVPAVFVVPGYEVAGNIYMIAGVDPMNTPLIGGHQFLPMTDATITPAGAPDRAWQEPLIVVNMARTLLYVPR